MWEWRYRSTTLHLGIRRRWLANFTLRAFLPPGKEPSVLITSETGWAAVPVYTLWRELSHANPAKWTTDVYPVLYTDWAISAHVLCAWFPEIRYIFLFQKLTAFCITNGTFIADTSYGFVAIKKFSCKIFRSNTCYVAVFCWKLRSSRYYISASHAVDSGYKPRPGAATVTDVTTSCVVWLIFVNNRIYLYSLLPENTIK
jgi:hypothetical protein